MVERLADRLLRHLSRCLVVKLVPFLKFSGHVRKHRPHPGGDDVAGRLDEEGNGFALFEDESEELGHLGAFYPIIRIAIRFFLCAVFRDLGFYREDGARYAAVLEMLYRGFLVESSVAQTWMPSRIGL